MRKQKIEPVRFAAPVIPNGKDRHLMPPPRGPIVVYINGECVTKVWEPKKDGNLS